MKFRPKDDKSLSRCLSLVTPAPFPPPRCYAEGVPHSPTHRCRLASHPLTSLSCMGCQHSLSCASGLHSHCRLATGWSCGEARRMAAHGDAHGLTASGVCAAACRSTMAAPGGAGSCVWSSPSPTFGPGCRRSGLRSRRRRTRRRPNGKSKAAGRSRRWATAARFLCAACSDAQQRLSHAGFGIHVAGMFSCRVRPQRRSLAPRRTACCALRAMAAKCAAPHPPAPLSSRFRAWLPSQCCRQC